MELFRELDFKFLGFMVNEYLKLDITLSEGRKYNVA